MMWHTPLGLPVVQPYRRKDKQHVRTLLQVGGERGGRRRAGTLYVVFATVDCMGMGWLIGKFRGLPCPKTAAPRAAARLICLPRNPLCGAGPGAG